VADCPEAVERCVGSGTAECYLGAVECLVGIDLGMVGEAEDERSYEEYCIISGSRPGGIPMERRNRTCYPKAVACSEDSSYNNRRSYYYYCYCPKAVVYRNLRRRSDPEVLEQPEADELIRQPLECAQLDEQRWWLQARRHCLGKVRSGLDPERYSQTCHSGLVQRSQSRRVLGLHHHQGRRRPNIAGAHLASYFRPCSLCFGIES